MAGLSGVSDYIKIAFGLTIVTWGVITICYFSPYWVVYDEGHAGLWQGCTGKICYDRWNLWNERWVKSCQVFSTAAYVLVHWTIFLLILFVWHKRWEQDKRLVFLAALAMLIACGMMFFSSTTWAGAQYKGGTTHLSWAFAFACLSVSTSIFTVVFLVLDLRRPVVIDEAHQLLIESSVYGEHDYLYKLPDSRYADLDTTVASKLNDSNCI